MLRRAARMLARHVPCCCQGPKTQLLVPSSSCVHGAGHASGAAHHRHQAAHPVSLWSAVFQGHLGRPQLWSAAAPLHTTAAAAAAAGRGGSPGPTESRDPTAENRHNNGPVQRLNRQRQRSSSRTSSKQPVAVSTTSSSSSSSSSSSNGSGSSRTPRAGELGAQFFSQADGPVAAPAQQQPVDQQHTPLSTQQQKQPEATSGFEHSWSVVQQPLAAAGPQAVKSKTKQIGPSKKRAASSSGTPVEPSKTAGSTSGSSSSSNGTKHSSKDSPVSSSSSSGRSSSSSSSSSISSSSITSSVAPAATAGVVTTEASAALQSAFTQQRPLLPPSRPVSDQVLQWASVIEAAPVTAWEDVLGRWRAGMDTVTHPFTQEQVEVLSLPYYRHGKLVDVRHLHIQDGRLEASWLAAEAAEPFLMEQGDLQGAQQVVFVGSELDALLLTATQPDWPVIALTQQSPQWFPADQQQQQQQQQQEQQGEDPRRRLLGLQDEVYRLRQAYELGQQRQAVMTPAAYGDHSAAAAAALDTAAVSGSPSGLQLLLGQPLRQPASSNSSGEQERGEEAQDCVAVIALPEGPALHLLSDALANLLGELHCRQAVWPSSQYASPAALYQHAYLAAQQHEAADAAAAAAIEDSDAPAPAASAAAGPDDPHELQDATIVACNVLAGLAGLPVMDSWSVLGVHLLHGFLPQGGTQLPGGVSGCLEEATIWPLTGLERFSDFAEDFLQYWDQSDVTKQPRSSGWPSIDDYYKVVPGEVTIVTGVPNSGKSEWLDALAVNLAESAGWRFAMASMEKKPRDHARQLLEKRARKPLLEADYARGVPQMSPEEFEEAYRWMEQHFYVIAAGDGNMPTICWVLEKARAAKLQYGINGLIIDPYNELNPSRAAGLKEHEHVNQTMALLRKFARDYDVCVWLVAHPRQFGNQWAGQRPGLQDISGGANFANKADNGVVVHRDWARLRELRDRAAEAAGKPPGTSGEGGSRSRRRSRRSSRGDEGEGEDGEETEDPLEELQVQVFIEKVRNKSTGSRGEAVLYYDRASGRYYDARDAFEFPQWEANLEAAAAAMAASRPPSRQQQQQQQGEQQAQEQVKAAAVPPGSDGPGVVVVEEEATPELEAQLREQEERDRARLAQYEVTEGSSEQISSLGTE